MLNKNVALICISFFLGCTQSIEEVINQKYFEHKSFFPSNFVNHFPNKLNDNIDLHIYSVTEKDWTLPITILLTERYNEITHQSFMDSVRTNSVVLYNANDSCLIIVDRFHNRSNRFDYIIYLSREDSLLLEKQCYEDKLPVPNFFSSFYHDENEECRLTKDFKIYVIEARDGIHWRKEYLKDGRYMPSKWKNGYSKGISISKERNIIIYWFVIW